MYTRYNGRTRFMKKDIALIGFGVTGQAVARYFLSRGGVVHLYDQRERGELNPKALDEFKALSGKLIIHGGNDTDIDFTNISTLVISPGVKPNHPAVQKARDLKIPIKHDVMIFLEKWNERGPVVGVTGSNGKSTVVTLLRDVLKNCGRPVRLGGNIGNSPLDWLSEGVEDGTYIVLEISNYMLDYFTEEHFVDVAVITNITNNHLDRYDGSMKKYADVKYRLVKEGHTEVVIDMDDEGIQKYISPKIKNNSVIPISFELPLDQVNQNGIYLDEKSNLVFYNKGKTEMLLENPANRKIKGIHNLYNISLVFGALQMLSIDCDNIAESMREFNGLEHRIEFVSKKDGITFIDDSKSTSPDATIKAIDTLSNGKNIVLISGGDDKGMDYESLKDTFAESVKKIIILPGTAEDKLKDISGEIPVFIVSDMDQAVKESIKDLVEGDVVLLSPATSSVAHFGSFEKRGDAFKKAVSSNI